MHPRSEAQSHPSGNYSWNQFQLKPEFRIGRSLICIAVSFGLMSVIGCSSSDSDSTSTSNPNKYEVVEATPSNSSNASSANTPKNQATPSGSDTSNGSSRSGSPATIPSAGRVGKTAQPSGTPMGTAGKATKTSSGTTKRPPPTKQPPSVAASDLNSYQVPDGSPQDMLNFIASIDRSVREMTSAPVAPEQRNLVRERIRQAFVAKEKAADRAYAESTEAQIRFLAAQAKMDSLLGLVGMGDNSAPDRVLAFATTLEASEDQRLVQQGRQLLLSIEVGKLSAGQEIDVAKLLKSCQQLLAGSAVDTSLVDTIQRTCAALNSAGKVEDAIKLVGIAATELQKSESAEIAEIGRSFAQQYLVQKLDFPKKVAALMREETPKSRQDYLSAVEQISKISNPTEAVFFNLAQALQPLEYYGRFELCRETCDAINKIFGQHPDEQLRTAAKQQTEDVLARLGLIGKPIKMDGLVLADGKPFDWKQYRGKVVMIEFWLSHAQAWQRQLPDFQKIYQEYHSKGFEIVGINLDQDRSTAETFLFRTKLPWPVTYSAEPGANAVAMACRVSSIPFSLLVGADGKVVDLYTNPDRLKVHLENLLSGKKPTETKDSSADKKTNDVSFDDQLFQRLSSQTHPARFTVAGYLLQEEQPQDTQQANDSEATELPEASENPYSVRDGATAAQLVTYLLDMSDKPRTIQNRAAFRQAMVAASDQLLKAARSKRDTVLAASTKFESLHFLAFDGDKAADEALAAFAKARRSDAIPQVSEQANLYLLERQALDSKSLDSKEIPALVEKLYRAFSDLESLDDRHLRIASATVRAINQLESEESRGTEFDRFGKLFAKSEDAELRRYGKQLAKPTAGGSALVGKALALDGVTEIGVEFDWDTYRGKVILVDFWATWCGPCIREMPQVKAAYEKWKDKGFDVVGINLDKDPQALASFLKDNPMPWSQLVSEGAAEAAKAYGVRGIPTMMVIDRDGKILAVAHRIAELEPTIAKQLEASSD